MVVPARLGGRGVASGLMVVALDADVGALLAAVGALLTAVGALLTAVGAFEVCDGATEAADLMGTTVLASEPAIDGARDLLALVRRLTRDSASSCLEACDRAELRMSSSLACLDDRLLRLLMLAARSTDPILDLLLLRPLTAVSAMVMAVGAR